MWRLKSLAVVALAGVVLTATSCGDEATGDGPDTGADSGGTDGGDVGDAVDDDSTSWFDGTYSESRIRPPQEHCTDGIDNNGDDDLDCDDVECVMRLICTDTVIDETEPNNTSEQAEVFEIESEATKIGFEANQMKSFNVEETRGVAARVVVDGRLGFAASSDLDATDNVVTNALESARHGDAIPTLRFPEPRPGPQVQVYDPELAALPTDRLIEMGQEIIAIVLEADADAHVNVDLTRQVRKTRVRNSAGAEVAVEKAPFSIGVMVERVRGDDVVIIFETFSTAAKDEAGKRFAEVFEVDTGLCIYCGLCEEACPEEAIFMSKTYVVTGTSRELMIFDKSKLYEIGGVRRDDVKKWSSETKGSPSRSHLKGEQIVHTARSH